MTALKDLGEKQKEEYLKRALAAADWFVNTQVHTPKPWMADDCRYLYYYYMPENKYVPGINWSHGRALFVLTEAYKITGKGKYLESMERAMRYIRALQPLDSHYPISYGVFREQIPQSPWGGLLDGAQLASGLLMLYRVTGAEEYLRRGRAFCEMLKRTWDDELTFPKRVWFYPEKLDYFEPPVWLAHYCTAIPLWHLYKATGERWCLPMIVKSADGILACQREDGALLEAEDISAMPEPRANQHTGRGEGREKYVNRNDDGSITVVLAAYEITGDSRYIEALDRYIGWITAQNPPPERPICGFGVQACNVLDYDAVTGKDHSAWVLENLDKYCLEKQVVAGGDERAYGGFRGEDEEGDTGVFGGTALDYVTTRTTCYMAGLLFRLSGKGAGAGFSVFGLDNPGNQR